VNLDGGIFSKRPLAFPPNILSATLNIRYNNLIKEKRRINVENL
jgi:hypothetical protein